MNIARKIVSALVLFVASACAMSGPSLRATEIEFVWGCWVAKNTPGGQPLAFLRLLPSEDRSSYVGHLQNLEFESSRLFFGFKRDGSYAELSSPLGDDSLDVIPGHVRKMYSRIRHPAGQVGARDHLAVFSDLHVPGETLVIEALGERLRISEGTVAQGPVRPLFDGERDGCD